jgi:dihydrofolate reductase
MRAAPQIVFVVAVAENGVIGRDNSMPWRLPSDLKRFKALTLNKPVIMGRKTFQSIGRPLAGRTNIVLTRDAGFRAERVVVVPTRQAAIDVASGDAARRGGSQIAVIGGAEIFRLFADDATRIEWTRVLDAPQGDAFLSEPDPARWQAVSEQPGERGPNDSAAVSYVTYARRL